MNISRFLQATWSTTWKDLQILVKDRGFIAVIFFLPLIFSMLFGTVYQRAGQNNQENLTFPVALVNQDEGAYGQQITNILESVAVLDLTSFDLLEDARQKVIDSQALAAIVIPANLTEQVNAYQQAEVQVIIDPTQEQIASMVTGIMKEVVSPAIVQGEIAYGIRSLLEDTPLYQQADDATRGALAAQSMAVQMAQVQKMMSDPWIEVETKTSQGKDMVVIATNPFTLIVPSFTVYFAFFMVGSMSAELLKEKRQGTLRRLVAAPVARTTVIAGKMVAYVIMVIMQVLLLFGVGSLAFAMPLGKSFIGLLLVIIATGLAVTGMGMLIASLAKTDRQADTIGTVQGFVLGALGGCFSFAFGSGVLMSKGGGTMEIISKFTPQAHSLMAFDTLMNLGGGITQVLPQVLILLGFTLVFLLVASWRFRYE